MYVRMQIYIEDAKIALPTPILLLQARNCWQAAEETDRENGGSERGTQKFIKHVLRHTKDIPNTSQKWVNMFISRST